MKKPNLNYIYIICLLLMLGSCKTPGVAPKKVNKAVPERFNNSLDTINTATINWRDYFKDPYLTALIDTALNNNQELNITLQEIQIGRNEVQTRKGEYLPFVGLRGEAGIEKDGRFTRHGAVDENLNIREGQAFPEPMSNFMVGPFASWELDVWKKLRNSKKAAVSGYLASVEGKNFMVTNLVAEIANSYYELAALDNLLEIVERNIRIQDNALQVIKQQKEAAKANQLAVNRFRALLLNTQNLQYEIKQNITETENRINFLVGRFPQPVMRKSIDFNEVDMGPLNTGIPSQLLVNRPDIRQAEMELAAADLDIKVARANFYPSIKLEAGIGLEAFDPALLLKPESLLYSLSGDLIAPLINRNAIKAAYKTANAKQIQAAFDYEQNILNAYIEVLNQLSKIENYGNSFHTKSEEVDILVESVSISNSLFRSARADYIEILLTQREALESKMELIEVKLKQINAQVDLYRALGGGWR